MQKVIALVGPTASGKTTFSIALAKALDGEVISADSRQVYKGLDIGTGKITPEEMQGVPHHLLDVRDPSAMFSAAEYAKEARAAISAIALSGHIPILVGGTGFYVDVALGRASVAEAPVNPALRAELEQKGTEELFSILEKLDSKKAATIDKNNRVRLIRAIEIARALGGVPETKPERLYDVLWLGIALPKEKLAENIHARLRARMEAGMLEEARALHASGLSYERMEELGLEYRHMARHLSGKMTREEMLQELESEIKKYAKRQMTWFKRNKNIHWFSQGDEKTTIALAREFLAR